MKHVSVKLFVAMTGMLLLAMAMRGALALADGDPYRLIPAIVGVVAIAVPLLRLARWKQRGELTNVRVWTTAGWAWGITVAVEALDAILSYDPFRLLIAGGMGAGVCLVLIAVRRYRTAKSAEGDSAPHSAIK